MISLVISLIVLDYKGSMKLAVPGNLLINHEDFLDFQLSVLPVYKAVAVVWFLHLLKLVFSFRTIVTNQK